MNVRRLTCLLVLALSCSSQPATQTQTTSTSTTEDPAAANTSTIDAADSTEANSTEADSTVDQDSDSRADLLAFANGAVVVSTAGLGANSAAVALRMIDGNAEVRDVPSDGPVEIVLGLPAVTTFDLFTIPNVNDPPGPATFFRDVEIAGSNEGPDSGYVVLATAELTSQLSGKTSHLVPRVARPVRWIRLRLANGIGAPTRGRLMLGFSEVIGTGSQEEIPLTDAYSGTWNLYSADRPGERGEPMELLQDGTTLTGCVGDTALHGTVNGSIARMLGSTISGTPIAYVLVPDGTGNLQGVVSAGDGVFGARVAIPSSDEKPCSVPIPAVTTCGAVVYVNFAADSDEIRPESRAVLADLFERIRRAAIDRLTVEGHTSTEAEAAYNQELSERRAAAVADDLVRRGVDPTSISVEGKGETEPLVFPEEDEAARSINRRVEIACG